MRNTCHHARSTIALAALGGALLLSSCTAAPVADESSTATPDRPTASPSIESTPTNDPTQVQPAPDVDVTFDVGDGLPSELSFHIDSTRFTRDEAQQYTTRYEDPSGCYVEFSEQGHNAMGAGDRDATVYALERRGIDATDKEASLVRYPYGPTGAGISRNIEFLGVHHIDADTAASVYTTARVLSESGELLLIEYGCSAASDLDGYVASMQPEFTVSVAG